MLRTDQKADEFGIPTTQHVQREANVMEASTLPRHLQEVLRAKFCETLRSPRGIVPNAPMFNP